MKLFGKNKKKEHLPRAGGPGCMGCQNPGDTDNIFIFQMGIGLIVMIVVIYLVISNHIWIGKKCGDNSTILKIANLFWSGWLWLIRKINPTIIGCEKD
uniref:Uncharacterized protein n=1 Tax=Megaviridae environmental sample TaxID=1737588 RepID=A0A5J6VKW4_9VIRU|nr:MAG: hypothetical protein [Megaviridae environmental sample]